MTFQLDFPALRRAEKKLSIDVPIKYEVTRKTRSRSIGELDTSEYINDHKATLRISPDCIIYVSPNYVLWHELTHAMQFGRDYDHDPVAFAAAYVRQLVEAGCATTNDYYNYDVTPLYQENYDKWHLLYSNIPIEKEANEMASSMAAAYPLVVV